MSETVHYRGKLHLVEKLPNETLEEQCKRLLSENNYLELNDYCDSWIEMLCEQLYEQYIVVDDEVYKIIEKNREYATGDIFNAHDNKDGTVDYEVMYYNGGCDFNEAIEHALRNKHFMR